MDRTFNSTNPTYTPQFSLIENYVYMYHTNTFIILPSYPESIQDMMPASFATTTPLSRTAPIFSYQNSGPRSLQISLNLHRDLMTQINYNNSNINFDNVPLGDDYVDILIKQIQAIALPKYSASSKMVDPPIIAIRFGSDIFCKGVVTGSVGITYALPIITDKFGNDKYSQVGISFGIQEIDPYDADTVMLAGSYRGLSTTLERNLWKVAGG